MRIGNDAVDLIAGRQHIRSVQKRPVEADSVTAASGTILDLRITSKKAVFLADVVIDFDIVASSHGGIGTVRAVIQVRAVGGNQAGSTEVIGSVPWLMAQKIDGYRVEAALRNDVVRELSSGPLSGGILLNSGGIVDGITETVEREIAI